jgi:hypothetical protein
VLAEHEHDYLITLAEEVSEKRRRETWRWPEELLAELLEVLSIVRIELLASHGVKPANLPKPVRVTRPGSTLPPPSDGVRTMTAAEFARAHATGL